MKTENLKTRIFKKGNIAYLIIALGIFTLFPFFFISQYNHPSSEDDFGFGIKQTELLPSIVKAYKNRNGRYFQIVLGRINPLRYGSLQMYKILPLIVLCLFVIVISLFIHHLLKKYFTLKHTLAISFLIIFLYILQMPSTAEGFFWFSSYVTYMIPTILTFLLLLFLLKGISTNNTIQKIILTSASSILCIAIIGSNEISLLILNMIILFMNINNKLIRKGYNKILLFLLLVCLIFSAIAIIAPGNFLRVSNFEYANNFTWAIFGSLFLTIANIIKWSIPVLVVSIFYSIYWGIPLAHRMAVGKVNVGIDFRLSVIFFFALIYLSILFYVLATGRNIDRRVLNIIYLIFVIGWFFYLQLFLIKKFAGRLIQETRNSKLLLIALILVMLMLPLDLNSNISTAYIDLISGKAEKYDIELKNRYQLINTSKSDSCIVPALSEIPKTIFYKDIMVRNEKQNHHNKIYARYFGKSYIYLDSKNPDIKSNQETLKEFGKKKRKDFFDYLKKRESSY